MRKIGGVNAMAGQAGDLLTAMAARACVLIDLDGLGLELAALQLGTGGGEHDGMDAGPRKSPMEHVRALLAVKGVDDRRVVASEFEGACGERSSALTVRNSALEASTARTVTCPSAGSA